MNTVRIITPTGHLGTTPLEKASFDRRCALARLYGIAEDRVTDFGVIEPAHAIKFTTRRLRPSGSVGERDLFGSQQYAPLFDVEIP